MLDVLFLPVNVFNQPRYAALMVEQPSAMLVSEQPPTKRRKIDHTTMQHPQLFTYTIYKTPSILIPQQPRPITTKVSPSPCMPTTTPTYISEATIADLPTELLDHIFTFLPITFTRTTTRLVSKTWNDIILAPSFWKDFVLPRSSNISAEKYIEILSLPRFSQLHTVAFGWDQRVDDETISHLFQKNPHLISTLTTFEVQRCHGVSDASMVRIAGVRRLEHLRLYNSSNWRGITDAGVAALGQLPALQTLQLNYFKRISNAGLAHLGGLGGTLRELILVGSCLVSDQGIVNISALGGLTSLAISLCGTLTNSTLRLIGASFQRLAHLALGYNNPASVFTDEGLAALHALPSLKELRLERTWGLLHGSGARLLKHHNPSLQIRQW